MTTTTRRCTGLTIAATLFELLLAMPVIQSVSGIDEHMFYLNISAAFFFLVACSPGARPGSNNDPSSIVQMVLRFLCGRLRLRLMSMWSCSYYIPTDRRPTKSSIHSNVCCRLRGVVLTVTFGTYGDTDYCFQMLGWSE